MRTQAAILALAAATSLATITASAKHFIVLDSSTMDDIRNIGGQSIPNLAEYQGFGGTLDITDPATWALMDSDFTTMPDEAVEPNSIHISGTLDLDDTGVTSATLTQLGALSFGLFQTEEVRSNLVTGAVGETIPTYAGRFNNPAGGQEYTALTWTYDAGTNTMGHDAATTNSGCLAVVGANPTGSCGLYRNGVTGATASSIWNWDGLVDGYTASNSRGVDAFPWGEDPASCSNGNCNAYSHVVIAKPGGTPGVGWDLSGLADCLAEGDCTITARVVASGMGDAPNGANNTAVSALYTLDLLEEGRPKARNDEAEVLDRQAREIDVLANDIYDANDNFSLRVVSAPGQGEAVEANGKIQYTPRATAGGTDQFTYRIESGGYQSTATVTVQLGDAPENPGSGTSNDTDDSGGSSSLDLWLLSMLGAGIWLRRRRPA